MNKKLPFYFTFLVASIYMGGCVSVSEQTPTSTPWVAPTPTIGITPLPTMPQVDTIPSTRPINKVSYDIKAKMNYDAKSLIVDEVIHFSNGTGMTLPDIQFVVLPNAVAGTFELIQISLNGQIYEKYELVGQSLLIKGLQLSDGDGLEIAIRFKLSLPLATQGDPNVIRPTIFGVSDKQVNITDWYPMVVPYTQNGWLLHDPGYFGEHLVYPAADMTLDLTFTDAANLPTIAASSLMFGPEGSHEYKLTNSRDFVLSMGRQMRVRSGSIRGITVNSHYYDPYETAGEAVLQTTLNAVDLFTHLFGPLQERESISAVQGDFDDGMEFDGLYYLSNSFYNLYDGKPNQYLILVAAHETCHQWWFGQVANDQAVSPWLDESLSTYCEQLYYENFHPELVDWWWMTRVNFYEPSGYIDGPVTTYSGFEPYTNATYRRGAKFLHELRGLIGDEAFFGTLKQYADELRFQIAEPADFFRILRQNTDADLAGLLAEYFQNSY